jgi:DNA-binding transcriptional ArsR family regulator
MSSPLESVVMHDLRLDILCCLVGSDPLTVAQLSSRVGKSPRSVGHHVKLLDSFGLIKKTGDQEGEEPVHAACLDEHPDWVSEAVRDHRRS